MNKVSKLFDSRSKKYNHIYGEANSNKLLHQEKRIRAALAEEFVNRYLSPNKEEKIVDIGCGMGNILLNLKGDGIRAKMFGVDISKEMIGIANKKLDLHRYEDINFVRGGIEDIAFKANIVMSLGVIGYQEKQEEFLSDLASIVDDNGYLIFSTANGDSFLRLVRRTLSKIHSLVTGKTKSKGINFNTLKDKQVECVLIKNGFELEKKVYITFGLGLFPSAIECSIDRMLFQYLNDRFIGKYLSLTVVYVYKKETLFKIENI